jgi:broad specificity phosphatase PhoE
MARLYLVRHGEPSVTGVLCGQADPPLSGNGRAQAAAVRLPAFPVYSSPLRRAIETARLFSGDCEVVVEPGFAEISYGKWDGRSWAEIAACDPHAASAKAADWFGVTPPGGEPWDSFCSRVLAALARIRRPAIIVAHEAVNSVIVEAATGRDPRSFVQSYCEVIEVEI